MASLTDVIREEILNAADQGEPDMTPRQAEALTVRLARRLRPLLLGQDAALERSGLLRSKAEEPTRRQVQILEMFAGGQTPSEVAAAFGVQRATVLDHLRGLAQRWNLAVDPCQLVNAGFERRWLSMPGRRAEVLVDARELTALGMIAQGREPEIGHVLGLSDDEVAAQRTRLMLAFGVETDAGLVGAAWHAGLLPVAGGGTPHSKLLAS